MMILLSVGSALVSHQIYKRHEPSVHVAGVIFVVGQAALLLWFNNQGLGLFAAVREATFLTVIHLAALTASIFAYRLFWHPLRHFPGPPLARLSKFWAIPTSFQGDMHLLLRELHQKYGDFVRVGPNELSICNADAVSPIYGANGWEKGPAYTAITQLKQGEPALEDIRYHGAHARRRKIWDAGFTTKALVEYQELVRERTTQFIDTLSDRVGTPVDMRLFFQFFATDIMFDLAFGGRGPQLMKARKDVTGMFEAMLSYLQIVVSIGNVPSLTPIVKLLPPDPKVAKFIELCDQCYFARVEDPSPSRDIFRFLVSDVGPARTSENDQRLLREAHADTLLLIVAGADTTSSVLANLLFLLVTEPGMKSLHRIQSEIDNAHNDKEDLDWHEVGQRVPFLDCCINETMRLFPPGLVGPFQRMAPVGGGIVCDRFIPAGTNVVVPQYPLHRDSRYFDEPDKFIPERWMPGSREKIHKTAFMPFSYGPYSCIGKQLALQEMRLAMTAILREFDPKVADNFDADKFAKSSKAFFTLQILEKLPVIFTRRQAKSKA